MHKLTNDRRKWGWAALLAGMMLGTFGLLSRRLWSRRIITARHPPAGFHNATPLGTGLRDMGRQKRGEVEPSFAVELRHPTATRTRIRVYARRTRRTIWTQTLCQVEVVRWSKDHLALA